MYWALSGDRQSTVITVGANGSCAIGGTGSQFPPRLSHSLRNLTNDPQYVEQLASWEDRLQACRCEWQLRHSPSSLYEDERDVPTYAKPLQLMIGRAKDNPENAQWQVACHGTRLSFAFVVTSAVFDQSRRQYELLLASSSPLKYSISFRFLGLTLDRTPSGHPSFAQFFEGEPLTGDGHMSISVRSPERNDA
jgi:hypothetical protein